MLDTVFVIRSSLIEVVLLVEIFPVNNSIFFSRLLCWKEMDTKRCVVGQTANFRYWCDKLSFFFFAVNCGLLVQFQNLEVAILLLLFSPFCLFILKGG